MPATLLAPLAHGAAVLVFVCLLALGLDVIIDLIRNRGR